MTLEEAIFKALSNTNDAYLEEAENAAPLRRLPVRTAARRWIPAVAAAVLVLTVGAIAALSGVWDSLFIDRLHPSEAIIHKTESMVQDVQVSAAYDDMEITLTQTLGDAMSMYLAIDVKFSERLNLGQYLTDEDSSILMNLEGIRLYKDDGTEYAAQLHRPFLTRGRWDSAVYDPENNSVRFLATFTDDDAEFTDYDGIILVIKSIRGIVNGTEEEILLEGPFQITWKPENIGPVYEFELMDGEEKIGDVRLSSLSVSVSILSRKLDGENFQEKLAALQNSIRIRMKDGSDFSLQPRGGGGGSMISHTVWFDEILDLEQADTLFVAGYTLKLE